MKGCHFKKYRDWDLLDTLPKGWFVDEKTGSPINGYAFCRNGKTPLTSTKTALVRWGSPKKNLSNLLALPTNTPPQNPNTPPQKLSTPEKGYQYPARKVQELARLKFQKQLLKEIQFDIMVCKIEGWDQMEYINELQGLINSFKKDS